MPHHRHLYREETTLDTFTSTFLMRHNRSWLPKRTLAFGQSEGWRGLGVEGKNSRVDMCEACGLMLQMKALRGWNSSLWCFTVVDCYSAFSVFTLMAVECQILLSSSWGEITADVGTILLLIKKTHFLLTPTVVISIYLLIQFVGEIKGWDREVMGDLERAGELFSPEIQSAIFTLNIWNSAKLLCYYEPSLNNVSYII